MNILLFGNVLLPFNQIVRVIRLENNVKKFVISSYVEIRGCCTNFDKLSIL